MILDYTKAKEWAEKMIEEGVFKSGSESIGGMDSYPQEDYGVAEDGWTDVDALKIKGKGKGKGTFGCYNCGGLGHIAAIFFEWTRERWA